MILTRLAPKLLLTSERKTSQKISSLTKQNTNNNQNNKYNTDIHILGEGTDLENNRITCFPVTRSFALDKGEHMNSARQ